MSYEATLLVFGILLLLIGLVGKVKARELEVGTSSRITRVVTATLGIVLIVLSLSPDVARSWLFDSPGASQDAPEETPSSDPAEEDEPSEGDAPEPAAEASNQPVRVVRVRMSATGPFSSHGFLTPRGQIVAFGPSKDRSSYEITWTEGGEVRRGRARVLEQRNDNSLVPFLVLLERPEGLDPGPPRRIRNALSLEPDDRVERYLSATDRTPGRVLEVGVAAEGLPLSRALLTTDISAPGDAGAPVLDADGSLVAIVIGGRQGRTYSMPIETVRIGFPAAF